MISFLYRSDTHVADRSPASWKGDYVSEIWSSLEQIGELARKYRVQAVLDGGDYFHVKAASRNSHGLVVRSAEIHRQYPCPTYCIEGNHDVAYNNLDTVDRQPIGVLYASGVFRLLREEVFSASGIQVRVVGVPHSPFRTVDELRAIRKRPGDTHLIAVVHALAGKNPPAAVEEFFNEPVFRYQDLIVEDGPDVFLFGHWHKDQGIEHIDGRTFVNVGAVSRGALIRENLERTPKVVLVEISASGVSVGAIPLRVAPASEVFDLERKQRADDEGRQIEQFVEKLRTDPVFNPTSSLEQIIGSLDAIDDVRSLAFGYLERARQSGRR